MRRTKIWGVWTICPEPAHVERRYYQSLYVRMITEVSSEQVEGVCEN